MSSSLECCSRCLLLLISLLALGDGWRFLGPMRGPIDGSLIRENVRADHFVDAHCTKKQGKRPRGSVCSMQRSSSSRVPESRELRAQIAVSESECCCLVCFLPLASFGHLCVINGVIMYSIYVALSSGRQHPRLPWSSTSVYTSTNHWYSSTPRMAGAFSWTSIPPR